MKDERGGVLVEMAVVLPAFLILLVGTMKCSIILFNYSNAVYSVRAAARYASLHSDTSGNPTTAATINSIVSSNLRLAGGQAPAVLLLYGDRSSGSGNYVGDLVGVGVVWANANILGGSTFYLTSESYRIISH
jgi:Flp pilus assembly protein TadG